MVRSCSYGSSPCGSLPTCTCPNEYKNFFSFSWPHVDMRPCFHVDYKCKQHGLPDRKVHHMFPHHTTEELFNLNTIYFQEYEEDPTPGNRQAVINTGAELTRRGAW